MHREQGDTVASLTGGWTAGTYYDTGTISVTVSDLMTAQVNWVQGSTSSGLAATLATSINGLEGIPGSSCPTAAQIATATGYVSACASGWILASLSTLPRGQGRAIAEQGAGSLAGLSIFCADFSL